MNNIHRDTSPSPGEEKDSKQNFANEKHGNESLFTTSSSAYRIRHG